VESGIEYLSIDVRAEELVQCRLAISVNRLEHPSSSTSDLATVNVMVAWNKLNIGWLASDALCQLVQPIAGVDILFLLTGVRDVAGYDYARRPPLRESRYNISGIFQELPPRISIDRKSPTFSLLPEVYIG